MQKRLDPEKFGHQPMPLPNLDGLPLPRELRSGSFYRNRKVGTSYFCENVSDTSATFILLESRPPRLMMTFTQRLVWSWQYEEVSEAVELKRLKALLDGYRGGSRGAGSDRAPEENG